VELTYAGADLAAGRGSEGIAWCLRGIRNDGTFYGEIRFQSGEEKRCKATFVSGRLTPAECERIAALVGIIRQEPPPAEPPPRFAAFWEWLSPTDACDVRPLVWYRHSDEATSEAARAFLELAGLVERHLRPFYRNIAGPAS
jgi:hypothetical protein